MQAAPDRLQSEPAHTEEPISEAPTATDDSHLIHAVIENEVTLISPTFVTLPHTSPPPEEEASSTDLLTLIPDSSTLSVTENQLEEESHEVLFSSTQNILHSELDGTDQNQTEGSSGEFSGDGSEVKPLITEPTAESVAGSSTPHSDTEEITLIDLT